MLKESAGGKEGGKKVEKPADTKKPAISERVEKPTNSKKPAISEKVEKPTDTKKSAISDAKTDESAKKED